MKTDNEIKSEIHLQVAKLIQMSKKQLIEVIYHVSNLSSPTEESKMYLIDMAISKMAQPNK